MAAWVIGPPTHLTSHTPTSPHTLHYTPSHPHPPYHTPSHPPHNILTPIPPHPHTHPTTHTHTPPHTLTPTPPHPHPLHYTPTLPPSPPRTMRLNTAPSRVFTVRVRYLQQNCKQSCQEQQQTRMIYCTVLYWCRVSTKSTIQSYGDLLVPKHPDSQGSTVRC